MKLIFQGLVCKSFQPILGDAGASYHLTGHQVHLKPQAHKNRAPPPPLALRWGSLEFSNLLCSQSDTAEGRHREAHCQVRLPWLLLCPWITRAWLGKVRTQAQGERISPSNPRERDEEMERDTDDEAVFCLLKAMWSWTGYSTSPTLEGLVWGLEIEHVRWPKTNNRNSSR